MDERRTWFLQGLSAHVLALEAARRAMAADPHDRSVRESVRRVGWALHASARQSDVTDVAVASRRLQDCPDADLPERLDEVLAILRGAGDDGGSPKIHILVLDADAVSLRFLAAAVAGQNREIHGVATMDEAEQVLARREVALVVLDLKPSPGGDGREFLVRMRARPQTSIIPVIVVSSSADTQIRTECFALGADECIGKPFDPESLAACVAAKLRRGAETTRWSRLDPLTGLLNRVSFQRVYETTRARLGAERRPLCLGVIDLDRLKWVNDSYGHATGDEVLCAVAETLTGGLRGSDVLARWGGEEFVALLPDSTEAGAVRALAKALESFRERAFRAAGGGPFRCTFSAGVAEVGARPLDEAFVRADRALYLAKASGRNTVIGFSRHDAVEQQVLLVEDDDLIATIVKGLLRQDGFGVAHYTDGQSALEAAPNLRCSLGMLDIRLPGANGFELLQKLRELPQFAGVPFVMVTGVREPAEISRAFALGAADYVVKPFAPEELMARVHRLVRAAT